MKAVSLLINSQLPPDLRDDNRIYDKKGIETLMAEVARRHPKQYSSIVQHIADVGRHAAYRQGETLGLNDFRPVIDKDGQIRQMKKEIAIAQRQAKSPDEAKKARMAIWARYATSMEGDTVNALLAKRNSLGNTIISGARGNPTQLKAIVTTPGLYNDYKDNPIPMFVEHSFGEGLRPAEYLASSFGVRRGVISTKASTSKGGDLLKQMVAATAPIVVTQDDCGTSNGISMKADDKELEGRVAGRDYGDVKRGDILTRREIAEIRKKGFKNIVVRSPMTCQAKEGICAHCLGALPDGKLAQKGYHAGITASHGLMEPVVQGALAQKQSGGGFSGTKKQFAGFSVINQLVQSPETFAHKAPVAEAAGRVERIDAAPQGGSFITVAGHKHYILPGYEPTVKPGDQVEAGEQLSEGIVDPADIVRLRGLGEGRKYYTERLGQALSESGAGTPSKINLETVARGIIDHVRIDNNEGLGDYLPDDLASYNHLSANYTPPEDTKLIDVEHAHGHTLQAPALHFTIGTKLTPKMTKQLKESGINHVPISDEEPAFVPEMVRLRAVAHNNPDWLAKMHSSYLGTNLAESATRSRDTNTNENIHFAPRLAKGDLFGSKLNTTGKF